MTKLYPNCSETVNHLGVKKSEIPYIIKRVKELAGEDKELLKHFTDCIEKPDGSGNGWISEGSADTYNKIKDELLAKRSKKMCPFCKEKTENVFAHIKEFHQEETKIVVGSIDKEEYNKLRKEIIVDEL